MQTDPTPPPDYTPASAMSLKELRAEMLQQAATLAAKARGARRSGRLSQARALDKRAARLVEIAKSVNVS